MGLKQIDWGISLKALVLSALLLLLDPEEGAAATRPEKPNVLFLIGDDHAAHAYGAYGNPLVKTPNLDGLAESGVIFTNAFCNSPICTCSRQSLLTGVLPHAIGVRLLQDALSEETVTLADLFKGAGYATAAIGKMHFNSDLHHGFDLRLDGPDFAAFRSRHPAQPIPSEIETLPVWRPFKDPARVWLNGSYLPYAARESDMPSAWFAEQAVEFMEDHVEKPFCLFASFTEPHSPFHFPVEYRGMFDPTRLQVPPVGPEDSPQIPEIFRDLTREEKQRITAAYYTSTAFLDRNVGGVLAALDRLGLREKTLVVYLGDNGYCLGHHGRFEKHCFYEQAVRVPLVVRAPWLDSRGVRAQGLVEFIDIFPTVTELTGVSSPGAVEGRSLVPLLAGRTSVGRNFAFSEYWHYESAMVRTADFKLIYERGKRERDDGYKTGLPLPGRTVKLFDLREDPQEMTNLAARPEQVARVREMEREMLLRLVGDEASRGVPDSLLEDRLDEALRRTDPEKVETP